MSNVYLVFLCSLVIFKGQVKGPLWHKIEGDPCADDDDHDPVDKMDVDSTFDPGPEIMGASTSSFHPTPTDPQAYASSSHVIPRDFLDFQASTSSSQPIPTDPQASTSSSQPIPTDPQASASSSNPVNKAKLAKEAGNTYFMEGKFEAAIRCYDKAIGINPFMAKYYRNRGLTFSRLDDNNSAMDNYVSALELEPLSVRGLFYMSRGHLALGNVEEAMEYIIKAFDNGKQQEIIPDEMYQVTTLQEKIKLKLEEIKRARRKELYENVKSLILEDKEHQIAEAGLEEIEGIKWLCDKYLKELKDAFPRVEEQTTFFHPDYLRDKISLELMSEPVVTTSGITYERSQIMKYLEDHEDDPTSHEYLHPDLLRPNNQLREAITDYMEKNGITVYD